MEPLARPSGFFLVQGRHYIPRTHSNEWMGTDKDSAAPYIRYLLEFLPLGVYIASPSGRLRIVSRALENLLGYGEGEAIGTELGIPDLFYHADNTQEDIGLQEIEDTLLMRRKNGSLVKAELAQKLVKDEHNNLLCVMGLVETETR